MALFYSRLKGVDFAATPDGNLAVRYREIDPEPLGELNLIALAAEKPESPVPVKVRLLRNEGKGLTFVAESSLLSTEGTITAFPDVPHFQFRLRITNRSNPGAYSLEVHFRTPSKGTPRFLVPGIFYKHNRPPNCTRIYPAFSLDTKEKKDAFISNYWAFRSDRCAEPAVFGWNDDLSFALATPAVFEKGQSGIFFSADNHNVEIGLHFPYREEPVKYSFCYDSMSAAERTFFHLRMGENFRVAFDFSVARRDLHFYAPFLRRLYERDHKSEITKPWMDAANANRLLTYGLFHWHYDGAESALWETCAFDKYFGKRNSYVERFNMHVAWVSGAPAAMALLWYGRITGNENYTNAALSVLNKIASGIAPPGTFYPAWEYGKGWTSGWNPSDDWIQARTAAEATLFLLRAVRLELRFGYAHPTWADAVKKSLEFAVKVQHEDGNFGSYYDVRTGEVTEWDGAGGLLWIAPLIGASVLFNEPRYRDAAIKAGKYYRRFVEDEFIYGAPEDVHLTPTSEDSYNALISYLLLGEICREERWFKLARIAADWLLTFRFSYNTRLPQHTILAQYDFHTKGGDVASPSNQHLHSYGLVCHPELMRLGKYLNDDYYVERAIEHLEFCHQFIARDDGDFGARKGMVPEQFYHTDWWQPKGHLLGVSHTWCAGLILYANLWEKERLGKSSIRLAQGTEPITTEATTPEKRTPLPISQTRTEELPPSERETLFDL